MNPFDRYDIDPSSPPAVITERFRELVADADEAEREALRAAWDALTLHPEDRVRAAFFSHPETRPPLGAAPRRRRAAPEEAPRLSLSGLLVLPGLSQELPSGSPEVSEFKLDFTDPALTEK